MTPRLYKLMKAIFDFVDNHGRMPSGGDLANKGCGIRGIVLRDMRRLEDLGYIGRFVKNGEWAETGFVTDTGRAVAILNPTVKSHTPRMTVYNGPGTLFKKSVIQPHREYTYTRPRALKPGYSSAKLGFHVKRGKWDGAKIYSLSLEERETCPSTCHMWKTCYGNNMPFAKRMKHGPELMEAIDTDLSALCCNGDELVVVRLHILGDFYSVEYVEFWEEKLDEYPNLRLFGYTAHPRNSDIGRAVYYLGWDRAAIRFSGSGLPMFGAEVGGELGFPCPEQAGTSPNCGECTACWEATKTVRFKMH